MARCTDDDPIYCSEQCKDGSGNQCEVDCDTWEPIAPPKNSPKDVSVDVK